MFKIIFLLMAILSFLFCTYLDLYNKENIGLQINGWGFLFLYLYLKEKS